MHSNPLAEPVIRRLLKALRHQEPDKVPDFECRIKRRSLQAILGRPSGSDSTELPPEEVTVHAREHIRRLAAGGGYVVSSSHSIQDSIPPANFRAMLDAVLTYG